MSFSLASVGPVGLGADMAKTFEEHPPEQEQLWLWVGVSVYQAPKALSCMKYLGVRGAKLETLPQRMPDTQMLQGRMTTALGER